MNTLRTQQFYYTCFSLRFTGAGYFPWSEESGCASLRQGISGPFRR